MSIKTCGLQALSFSAAAAVGITIFDAYKNELVTKTISITSQILPNHMHTMADTILTNTVTHLAEPAIAIIHQNPLTAFLATTLGMTILLKGLACSKKTPLDDNKEARNYGCNTLKSLSESFSIDLRNLGNGKMIFGTPVGFEKNRWVTDKGYLGILFAKTQNQIFSFVFSKNENNQIKIHPSEHTFIKIAGHEFIGNKNSDYYNIFWKLNTLTQSKTFNDQLDKTLVKNPADLLGFVKKEINNILDS